MVLASNLALLHLWHCQSGALIFRIHPQLGLISSTTPLHLNHSRIDLIHSRLHLIHSRLHCEAPVRILYKCLVLIYVFQEIKLLFPKQNYSSVSQILHSYIRERFIYFQDRSAYSAAGKYVNRSWQYINRSQTHKAGNWD